ncbi:penicillin-binding protein activator [Halomicrobium salinisoli]|uniref:penicillin-binding protein activator n=1 Tax=Halomicrobium salinisoli TaxID=2878391 RepID=UPI001CF047F1|nr:penicillin-binding protein activator [Halomicrobium salinisoli]
MTSRPTTDAEPEATSPLAQDTPAATPSGSSVYGGRPTFALTRRDGADGAALTLYELLPEDQAAARRERLERGGSNRKLVIKPFEDVFDGSTASAFDRWSWEGWTAVKITRLSGTRLRSILPLVRQTLGNTDLDESIATSNGDTDVFLPETSGVRLALGFLGIKPIQRVDRMRAFCRGVAQMSDEECYYWHAKCRSPTTPNGEKALRTLLTDHIH